MYSTLYYTYNSKEGILDKTLCFLILSLDQFNLQRWFMVRMYIMIGNYAFVNVYIYICFWFENISKYLVQVAEFRD